MRPAPRIAGQDWVLRFRRKAGGFSRTTRCGTIFCSTLIRGGSRHHSPRIRSKSISILFPRLCEREDQFAGTLSGGEQQMLAPLIIRDIFNIIRSLREQGLTILLVEQMASQALAVADHAYVLETGGITLQGKGWKLLNDPKIRAAYLGAH